MPQRQQEQEEHQRRRRGGRQKRHATFIFLLQCLLQQAPTILFHIAIARPCCCGAWTWTVQSVSRDRNTLHRFSGFTVRCRIAQTPTTLRMSTLSTGATATSTVHVKHIPDAFCPSWMIKERTRLLNDVALTMMGGNVQQVQQLGEPKDSRGCVVYWMQRDVRTADNWALLLAAHWAQQHQLPLRVLYALPPPPPPTKKESETLETIPNLANLPMTERHGQFLLGGLECVYNELKEWNVPLDVVLTNHGTELVGETVLQTLKEHSCRVIVTDMAPLRHHRQWTEQQAAPLLQNAQIPFVQVDAHNVVPVWVTSTKREYAARTIRPKIHKHYNQYLQKFPKIGKEVVLEHQNSCTLPNFKRTVYQDFIQLDSSVPALQWAQPGTEAGLQKAQFFFDNGLAKFDQLRNNPNELHAISNLSPWINHGHVSFQRLALAVKKLNKYPQGTAAFVEEGVVRRELSDNYVYYSPNDYDQLSAAADWAQETLRVHANDPREYVYTLSQFEQGETHDDLWNAAQLQAVRDGKMHGFLRMYWCKKILEWTASPDIALKTGLYLNDKFNVDGRDPNGFVGVGWSIMGIHDMGWKEREVFGKIRFMNYAGCKRKFNVPAFVARYKGASANATRAEGNHHQRTVGSSSQDSNKGGTKRSTNMKTTSTKSKKAKEVK